MPGGRDISAELQIVYTMSKEVPFGRKEHAKRRGGEHGNNHV